MEREWYVFREDWNKHQIVKYNVFNNYWLDKFMTDPETAKMGRSEFEMELNDTCLYAMWSKCEYEVIISSWPSYGTKKSILEAAKELAENPNRCCANIDPQVGVKVDVYEQLHLNWQAFVDYCWEHKEEA